MKKWVSGGFNKVVINLCGDKCFCTQTHTHTCMHANTLWSRQEDSFPYTVVCRSASRILMLSWRGCRACTKSMTLGQLHCGKTGSAATEGSECPLAVEVESAFRICQDQRWRGKRWEVFYLLIINSRDYPSLWNPLHSPSPLHLFLPMSSPPNSPSHTCFFPPSLCRPCDSPIPCILPWCLYQGHNRDSHGFRTLHKRPLITINGKSWCKKSL